MHEQAEHLRTHGYVIVPSVLSPTEIAEIFARRLHAINRCRPVTDPRLGAVLAPMGFVDFGLAVLHAHRPRQRMGSWHGDPDPRGLVAICFWALSDFTDRNGATELIPLVDGVESCPGRHPNDTPANEIVRATMKAGSVLIFLSTVLHRVGDNTDPVDVRWHIRSTAIARGG